MYLAIMDFLEPRIALLSPLPNFMSVYGTFVDRVTEIQRVTTQQSIRKQEVTNIKAEVRASFLSITAEIAHELHVLAHTLNDQVLLAETHFSLNEQETISDLILVDRAVRIYELAERHIPVLPNFNVNNDTLSKFKNAIDTFYALMPNSAESGGFSIFLILNLRRTSELQMSLSSILML